jgi:hypothetical protein
VPSCVIVDVNDGPTGAFEIVSPYLNKDKFTNEARKKKIDDMSGVCVEATRIRNTQDSD